jgi:cell division protein FtsL
MELSSSHLSNLRQKRSRLFRKAGVAALVCSIACMMLLIVWQSVQVRKVGYEIEALKKEKAEYARVNKNLQIETATLTSPDRIESLARDEIGMTVPVDKQIVLVKRVARGSGPAAEKSSRAQKPSSVPEKS